MARDLGSESRKRWLGLVQVLALSFGILLAGTSTAWADEEPPIPSDASHISLLGNQREELGSADVRVRSGPTLGMVNIEGWIKDTKEDSRCVYIEYKLITANGHDPDDTLVRVCGKDDTDYKIHDTTEVFFNVHESVEFKLCREEGAKFIDRDTCTKATTLYV